MEKQARGSPQEKFQRMETWSKRKGSSNDLSPQKTPHSKNNFSRKDTGKTISRPVPEFRDDVDVPKRISYMDDIFQPIQETKWLTEKEFTKMWESRKTIGKKGLEQLSKFFFQYGSSMEHRNQGYQGRLAQ